MQRIKAGFARGYQRYNQLADSSYKCKECVYYFTDTPVRGHSFQEKLLSLQLYASGLSLRRIGYLLHVSQVTIQKLVQRLVPELCPKLQPEGRVLVMELDEMWHYLHSKKTNSGSGSHTARLIDWEFGSRNRETLIKLIKRLEP